MRGTRVAQGISFLCATWSPLGRGEMLVFMGCKIACKRKLFGTDCKCLGRVYKGFEHLELWLGSCKHVRVYTACSLSIRVDPACTQDTQHQQKTTSSATKAVSCGLAFLSPRFGSLGRTGIFLGDWRWLEVLQRSCSRYIHSVVPILNPNITWRHIKSREWIEYDWMDFMDSN